MAWENQVRLICMLTTLVEGGKTKCHQYWPSAGSEPVQFGQFLVTLNKEAKRKGYVLRDISVQRQGAKGKRRLFQLQFTGWPDHGRAPTCFELNECLPTMCGFARRSA